MVGVIGVAVAESVDGRVGLAEHGELLVELVVGRRSGCGGGLGTSGDNDG